MFFDTHAHYDDPQFDPDRGALLESLPANGIDLVVCPGSDMASSRAVVGLAETYPFIWAAVGVHPHDSEAMDGESIPRLRELTRHPKVAAVGEIGLDYHYDNSPRDIQRRRFREQMALAREVELPVIVHEREAVRDTLEIIADFPGARGVVHCFSGSVETAKFLLDRGWYLSFTGIVTYKNARRSHEVIRYMPRDRIMLETDAPYLAPVPRRGERNSSLNLPHVAGTVAELLELTVEQVAALTMENGRRFFGLGH